LVLARVDEKDLDRVMQLLQWYGVLGVRDEQQEPKYIYDKNYSLAVFEAFFRSRLDASPVVFHPGFWRGLDIKAS
jgi:hypothetical protein